MESGPIPVSVCPTMSSAKSGASGLAMDVLLTFSSLPSKWSLSLFSKAPRLMKSMNFQSRVPMNLFSEFVCKNVLSSGIS